MGKLPRLIKSSSPVAATPVEFIDTLAATEKLINQKRSEIESYRTASISQIRQESEAASERARKEGYEAGYKEGLAKATADVEARHQEELAKEVGDRLAAYQPALDKLVAELDSARQQWLGEWERSGLSLACAIAARVVRGKVAQPNDVAYKALAEAVALLGRCPKVTIYLHPTDAETFDLNPGPWQNLMRHIETFEVESDPNMAPGGCRLESDFGVIDSSIETQLSRIERELLGEAESTVGRGPALTESAPAPPVPERDEELLEAPDDGSADLLAEEEVDVDELEDAVRNMEAIVEQLEHEVEPPATDFDAEPEVDAGDLDTIVDELEHLLPPAPPPSRKPPAPAASPKPPAADAEVDETDEDYEGASEDFDATMAQLDQLVQPWSKAPSRKPAAPPVDVELESETYEGADEDFDATMAQLDQLVQPWSKSQPPPLPSRVTQDVDEEDYEGAHEDFDATMKGLAELVGPWTKSISPAPSAPRPPAAEPAGDELDNGDYEGAHEDFDATMKDLDKLVEPWAKPSSDNPSP